MKKAKFEGDLFYVLGNVMPESLKILDAKRAEARESSAKEEVILGASQMLHPPSWEDVMHCYPDRTPSWIHLVRC